MTSNVEQFQALAFGHDTGVMVWELMQKPCQILKRQESQALGFLARGLQLNQVSLGAMQRVSKVRSQSGARLTKEERYGQGIMLEGQRGRTTRGN
jgi:hypothetical protein